MHILSLLQSVFFFTPRNKCTYCLYCKEVFSQEINAHVIFIAKRLGFFPQEINAHIAFIAQCICRGEVRSFPFPQRFLQERSCLRSPRKAHFLAEGNHSPSPQNKDYIFFRRREDALPPLIADYFFPQGKITARRDFSGGRNA